MDTKALQMAARHWAGRLKLSEDAETPFERNFVSFFRRADWEMRKSWQTLLIDLANLPLDSPRLQNRIRSFEAGRTPLATFKKDVQLIWSRDVGMELKQPTIDVYLHLATNRPSGLGLYSWLPLGYLSFERTNLPGQLVLAVLENWWRMARCGNPECPVPYFLAKRSTQRYCERGECTRYALRQKALKWWTEHGAEERKKKKSKRTRKERTT